MPLLDTTVVSEAIRDPPAPAVLAWVRVQGLEALSATTLNIFQVRFGLEALRPGRRQSRLIGLFEALLDDLFERFLILVYRHNLQCLKALRRNKATT